MTWLHNKIFGHSKKTKFICQINNARHEWNMLDIQWTRWPITTTDRLDQLFCIITFSSESEKSSSSCKFPIRCHSSVKGASRCCCLEIETWPNYAGNKIKTVTTTNPTVIKTWNHFWQWQRLFIINWWKCVFFNILKKKNATNWHDTCMLSHLLCLLLWFRNVLTPAAFTHRVPICSAQTNISHILSHSLPSLQILSPL